MPGLELLLMLAAVAGENPPERLLFDFSADSQPWPSIDDKVMGGRSSSEMRVEQGRAVFQGNVSLENNGGFASVRSRPDEHDLAGYRGIVLRLRGDGKSYGLRLKTDRNYDGVNYQTLFESRDGEWQEVRLAFEEFVPLFRGRLVRGYDPLDPAAIRSFGLIISQKQSGPFRLEIDWIGAYR